MFYPGVLWSKGNTGVPTFAVDSMFSLLLFRELIRTIIPLGVFIGKTMIHMVILDIGLKVLVFSAGHELDAGDIVGDLK